MLYSFMIAFVLCGLTVHGRTDSPTSFFFEQRAPLTESLHPENRNRRILFLTTEGLIHVGISTYPKIGCSTNRPVP